MALFGRIGTIREACEACAAYAALVLTLAGCQTTELFDGPRIAGTELLSGSAIFAKPVASDERPDIDILATDEAMRAFAARTVDTPNDFARLRELLTALRRGGYVLSGYAPYLNLTARETFAAKRGNCLSYSSLLVALARDAGLDAGFQMVDVPPDYDSVDDMVVVNKHVNVRLQGMPGRDAVTVEFNEEYTSDIYDRHPVDDRYALALHYNNVAFSLGLAGDRPGTVVYLRKAIEMVPDNPDFWANLAALYARAGRFEHAVSAHRRALDFDATHGAAVRGLANAYGALGRSDAARYFERRAVHSRVRHAYTYFTLALRAHEAEQPAESLELVSRAITLFGKDDRFFRLRGRIHDRLGDALAAAESFERARVIARNNDRRERPRATFDRHPRATIFMLKAPSRLY